jgi:ketosteroid isomerase-like protein
MNSETPTNTRAVLERIHDALNSSDLDAYVSCFSPEYRSVQPIHPEWTYSGRDQLRWNWTAIFENVRDFQAELLRSTIDGDTFWSEWRWTGTQPDGDPMTVVGVMIMGVEGERVAWGRIYMESEAGTRLSFREREHRRSKRMDA